MKLKVKILNDFVLVKERIYEEKTKDGIYLPAKTVDQSQAAQCEGEILVIGEQAFEGLEVKPEIGDIAYFPKYEGTGKKYGNIFYRIVPSSSIQMISNRYLEPEETLEN